MTLMYDLNFQGQMSKSGKCFGEILDLKKVRIDTKILSVL